MATVHLRGIGKSYGPVTVLKDVDLAIGHGEFVVFVGPSGCGKSTLLRTIAGLETATTGEISIGGAVVTDKSPAERRIAMVFQSYALYPHMTVYKNMGFGLRFSGVPKAEADARVRKAAKSLQLEALLDRLPRELSGGQRQRVAIGRAIVRDPAVFLFDEPLSNLDAALRVQTRLEIAKLHRELQATIVYVTHDQVEAMTLADRIVVMNAGRVEQVGTPLELYHRPANLFVAGFIGSPKMNFLAGRIAALGTDWVEVALPGASKARLPVAPGGAKPGDAVTLGLRPEHLAEAGDGGILLGGLVELVERLGEASYLYLKLDDGSLVTVRADGHSAARDGQRVTVGADIEAGHLFDGAGLAYAPLGRSPRYRPEIPQGAEAPA